MLLGPLVTQVSFSFRYVFIIPVCPEPSAGDSDQCLSIHGLRTEQMWE